jgi:pimeloyl-ACP methyl ester carboxylesterase
MPLVVNGGIRIHYEVEGEGEPLVMVDGFSTSLKMWQEQGYTGRLADSHRLILIDARGHGQSDKPHDAAQYRAELMVGDVVAVLDQLGVQKTHYMGASMGAAIGFEMARQAMGRLRTLTLMGYGRYGPPSAAQQQFQAAGRRMQELAATMGAEAALAEVEKLAGPRSPEARAAFLANFQANDQKALLAFILGFEEWRGFEDVLPGITVPCLIMVAESDPLYASARKCAEVMPHAVFVALGGGTHSQTSYGADIVLPHTRKFLNEARGS